MNRTDVDGLKGGEFNMFNGRKIRSFRLADGDTIFSPGPPNDPEHVAAQVNDGRMDGFVQAQADECGPATAHRVMGYHTAGNVPHLRLARARFRRLPPVVRPASRANVPEPLLRAHRQAEHRLVGRLGVHEHQPAAPGAHGHGLRAADRARGLLGLLRARLLLPAVLRAPHLRLAERRQLRRSGAWLPRAGQSREPAVRVVRRPALPRLPARQLLRRATVRPPQQPAVHPRPGGSPGREPEMGQDSPDHHLRRARRVLRSCPPGSRGQGVSRDAPDHGRAGTRLRDLTVAQRRHGVRLGHPAL